MKPGFIADTFFAVTKRRHFGNTQLNLLQHKGPMRSTSWKSVSRVVVIRIAWAGELHWFWVGTHNFEKLLEIHKNGKHARIVIELT